MPDDTAIRVAAQRYMERGWKIIPLYGVTEDGTGCLCGNPEHSGPGTSGGKHPIGAGGRGDGWLPPVDDPAQIPARANIGLKTGTASGVFALDVDPKNGGDLRLAELEDEHGALPPTWRQRTGSGGWHHVFSLPDDFTPTTSRGRLPVGLDIRGEGGQIVLAPSVSTTGPYTQANPAGLVVLPASTWLCDMIRPLPPMVVPAGYESAYMPEQAGDRGRAYAMSAIQGELSKLSGAVPGERNHTAFRVACRLIELSNAPWTGLSEQVALEAYTWFGRAITGPDFPDRELWACWNSAARKIGTGAALLPPKPNGAEFVAFGEVGGMPPFSGSASSANGAGPAPATAGAPFDPFSDPRPGPEYTPGAYAIPAQRGVQGPDGASGAQGGGGLRSLMLPRSQVARIPRQVPLIQGTLWRNTDAWLIGASGSGKSFVALDWAAHVATGKAWNGRRVWPGSVLYLVAEGASGIQKRLDAWELAQVKASQVAAASGTELPAYAIPDSFVVLPVAVQAIVRGGGRSFDRSPAWRELEGEMDLMRPALIVLDTQARLSLGLNENDNAEMGLFMEAVASLRRASGGACALVVHHTGRNGGDARGASAIDAAQDVEWKVDRHKGAASGELVLDKNKDGAEGVRIPFSLVKHSLGYDQETGEEVTSLTVSYDAFDRAASGAQMEYERNINLRQRELLLVIAEFGSPQGDTVNQLAQKVAEWCLQRSAAGLPSQLLTGNGKPVDRSTILRLLIEQGEGFKGLVGAGLVELISGAAPRYADPERYARYVEGKIAPLHA